MQSNKEQAKRGRPRKVKENLFRKKTTNKKVISNNQMTSKALVNFSQKRKRATNDSIYQNDKVKSEVMKRAEDVQANLAPALPSMIKSMLPSHVTGGFWLGLPKQFCDENMPKQDTMIVLADESGVEYETKYLTAKVGLSGGWRGFSLSHNLQAGDVLVFQLVRPTKFKVYIVRVNGSIEIDGALGLLELDASMKQLSNAMGSNAVREYIPNTLGEEMEESEPLLICNPELNSGLITDHSETESGDPGINGIRLSDSLVDFNHVKCFEDFEIVINGLIISSELPRHVQSKYYDICCSKKSFLHENLLEGINCKLAVGVIAETINIADAIRASKLTTNDESFTTCQKTLKAFKMLGMKVDFLLERLDQLRNLAVKSGRYEQLKRARLVSEEEMRATEAKLLELKEATNTLDVEIQQLETNSENFEIVFQEVAKAPW